MTRSVVLGRPNAGKTLFVLQFARYVGLEELAIQVERPGGETRRLRLAVEEAQSAFATPEPHQTRSLHSVDLNLPVAKGHKRFELVDTTGLQDGIHPDVEIRQAMAQTLAQVRRAGAILHVIDASRVDLQGAVEAIGDVDYQVAQFAQMRGGYAILANKMDLPGSERGLRQIRSQFQGHQIFPISALRRDGFEGVRRFLVRQVA